MIQLQPSRAAILISAPPAYEFVGTLLRTSAAGFWAECKTPELRPGDRVSFCHSTGEGYAIVAWTRILNSRVEAGFQITF